MTAPRLKRSRSTDALRALQAQGQYLFRAAKFAELSARSEQAQATRLALSRLARSGVVASVTKHPPTWLIVPAEHQHFGAPPVTWWLDDLLRESDPGYYLALLSAARHWGSAHYAPQFTQVMVGRTRRPLMVGRLKIEFTRKREVELTPVEVITRGTVAPFRVSTREATLLDLLRHQSEVGGLEAVARISRDFAPALTEAGLIGALNALDQTAVAQRLGFILQCLRVPLGRTVAKWLEPRRLQRQPLEPATMNRTGALLESKEWGVTFTKHQSVLLQETRS